MHPRRIWWAALLIGGVSACGPGNGLNLARVRGTITYEGRPIQFGNVLFVPDAAKGTDGPIAMSTILPDGSFDLSTEEPSDGAIVGHHKVRIVGLDPRPLTEAEIPKPDEDAKSFMAAKAKAASRRFAEAKGPRIHKARDGKNYHIIIPEKFDSPDTSGIEVVVARGSNRVPISLKSDGSSEVGP